MSTAARAVFLSYASEDAPAAQRIAEALRSAGVEVWFDREELRGGDAWDQKIRQQIRDCRLFVPIISANTEARLEGYFRREWKLAVDRTEDMAGKVTFLLPIVIDDTPNATAEVPERFRHVQWTRLRGGEATPAFAALINQLIGRTSQTNELSREFPIGSHDTTSTRPPVFPVKRRPSGRWQALIIGACVVSIAALGYLGYSRLSHRTSSSAMTAVPTTLAATDKSIAVLPFVDMSEKKDQEYFADGMAEEILDILAKIPQLTVIGRTSSFQFKGRTEDLRAIGDKLGAAYVVEGSVRRADRRIRVTAQLIDAQTGAHLWSDSYDRDYGDVLTLQDQIATAIARALQLTVGARDARPLRGEHATEAYTLYLRGKLAFDNFSGESLLEAQSAFQQALELDPTFVPAAEGLALTYLNRGFVGSISGREAWKQARSAAEKALQLSSRSAIAHCVLGVVAGMQDFDWATAERELQAALALNPNDSDMLQNAAQIAIAHGNRDEALRQMNAAVVVDPFNQGNYQVRGFIFYLTDDYSAAEADLRKSIAIYPGIDGSHGRLGFIQLLRGQPEAALKEFSSDPYGGTRAFGIALVGPAVGRKAESEAVLPRVVDEAGSAWPYGIALLYAYRGEHDQAFAWLEKARDARDGDLFFLLCDPLLKPMHDDPRWSALMKSMNLGK
jgi:TolB-like protein